MIITGVLAEGFNSTENATQIWEAWKQYWQPFSTFRKAQKIKQKFYHELRWSQLRWWSNCSSGDKTDNTTVHAVKMQWKRFDSIRSLTNWLFLTYLSLNYRKFLLILTGKYERYCTITYNCIWMVSIDP